MDQASQLTGERFVLGHAQAPTWQEAARSVAEQLGDRDDDGVGFLYVTDHLADHLGDIAAFLAAATGTLNWCGTIGIGICATGREYFDKPAVVALSCRFPNSETALFGSVDEAIEGYRELGTSSGGAFSIVQGDPRIAELVGDVPRLARDTDGFLVGGLTSSRVAFGMMAGHPVEASLTGLMITGAHVATGLTQGCSPMGGYHEITSADGNLIAELDGRSATDVFFEVLGEAGISDLRSLSGALHVAFPVKGSDTGDYLVRNLVGLDPDAGVVAVGDNVDVGDAMMFCLRDRDAAEKDLRRMLDNIKARALRPLGGLYFSCLARGPNLFGDEGREMEIIREVLGDLPIAGFFGNGEISFDRLYAYTGVLTLFLEPENING